MGTISMSSPTLKVTCTASASRASVTSTAVTISYKASGGGGSSSSYTAYNVHVNVSGAVSATLTLNSKGTTWHTNNTKSKSGSQAITWTSGNKTVKFVLYHNGSNKGSTSVTLGCPTYWTYVTRCTNVTIQESTVSPNDTIHFNYSGAAAGANNPIYGYWATVYSEGTKVGTTSKKVSTSAGSGSGSVAPSEVGLAQWPPAKNLNIDIQIDGANNDPIGTLSSNTVMTDDLPLFNSWEPYEATESEEQIIEGAYKSGNNLYLDKSKRNFEVKVLFEDMTNDENALDFFCIEHEGGVEQVNTISTGEAQLIIQEFTSNSNEYEEELEDDPSEDGEMYLVEADGEGQEEPFSETSDEPKRKQCTDFGYDEDLELWWATFAFDETDLNSAYDFYMYDGWVVGVPGVIQFLVSNISEELALSVDTDNINTQIYKGEYAIYRAAKENTYTCLASSNAGIKSYVWYSRYGSDPDTWITTQTSDENGWDIIEGKDSNALFFDAGYNDTINFYQIKCITIDNTEEQCISESPIYIRPSEGLVLNLLTTDAVNNFGVNYEFYRLYYKNYIRYTYSFITPSVGMHLAEVQFGYKSGDSFNIEQVVNYGSGALYKDINYQTITVTPAYRIHDLYEDSFSEVNIYTYEVNELAETKIFTLYKPENFFNNLNMLPVTNEATITYHPLTGKMNSGSTPNNLSFEIPFKDSDLPLNDAYFTFDLLLNGEEFFTNKSVGYDVKCNINYNSVNNNDSFSIVFDALEKNIQNPRILTMHEYWFYTNNALNASEGGWYIPPDPVRGEEGMNDKIGNLEFTILIKDALGSTIYSKNAKLYYDCRELPTLDSASVAKPYQIEYAWKDSYYADTYEWQHSSDIYDTALFKDDVIRFKFPIKKDLNKKFPVYYIDYKIAGSDWTNYQQINIPDTITADEYNYTTVPYKLTINNTPGNLLDFTFRIRVYDKILKKFTNDNIPSEIRYFNFDYGNNVGPVNTIHKPPMITTVPIAINTALTSKSGDNDIRLGYNINSFNAIYKDNIFPVFARGSEATEFSVEERVNYNNFINYVERGLYIYNDEIYVKLTTNDEYDSDETYYKHNGGFGEIFLDIYSRDNTGEYSLIQTHKINEWKSDSNNYNVAQNFIENNNIMVENININLEVIHLKLRIEISVKDYDKIEIIDEVEVRSPIFKGESQFYAINWKQRPTVSYRKNRIGINNGEPYTDSVVSILAIEETINKIRTDFFPPGESSPVYTTSISIVDGQMTGLTINKGNSTDGWTLENYELGYDLSNGKVYIGIDGTLQMVGGVLLDGENANGLYYTDEDETLLGMHLAGINQVGTVSADDQHFTGNKKFNDGIAFPGAENEMKWVRKTNGNLVLTTVENS